MKLKFSTKFYVGVVLVILSFVLGKVTNIIFIVYFNNVFWRWFSIIVYILSWPMLIVGAWWAGKEYAEKIKRYFSYRFYHDRMKNKTKKVYNQLKERQRESRKK